MKRIVLLLVGVLAVGCQLTPTKTKQTADVDHSLLYNSLKRAIIIDDKTVVIDVRSAFEFSSHRIPGSVNLRWEEFSQSDAKYPGQITLNLEGAARRLSLLGVNPSTRVVVVGLGIRGRGEEARMAWTLYAFGIKNVEVASIDYFRTGLGHLEPRPKANVSPWKINIPSPLIATREEVLKVATSKGPSGTHIIDVRSRQEYFNRKGFGQGYTTPELRALHIPWVEFYNADGRPEVGIKSKLQAVGVGLNDRIIVISEKGVRSAAVAFALITIGFNNVANSVGGYPELLSKK